MCGQNKIFFGPCNIGFGGMISLATFWIDTGIMNE
jgi:hypothetical protein